MADTAAFFAKKKKGGKKKAFKAFNANKIDVSAVASTVHVDAPAISSSADGDLGGVSTSMAATSLSTEAVAGETGAGTTVDANVGTPSASEQWDDEALAAKMSRGPAVTTATAKKGAGVTELMNMQELESKRREEDDIAERMRVEETKAALAAAKEGMEREAKRLEAEAEAKKKAQQDAAIGKPRFGKAAAALGDSGPGGSSASSSGKWVPPHMRSSGSGVSGAFSSSGGSSFGGSSSIGGGLMGSSSGGTPGFQRKVDTQDENMFPDLATADAIVSQQQQQKQTQAMPRRTKPGANAWGAAKKSGPASSAPSAKNPAPPPAPSPAPQPAPEPPATESTTTTTEKTTPNTAATTAVTPAAAPKPDVGAGLKKKKKKKKDLSTFKPS